MPQEMQHAIEIAVIAGPDDIVRVGAPFAITARIGCKSGCRLGPLPLEIRQPCGATQTIDITGRQETSIGLVAGARPGVQTWTFSCAASEKVVPCHAATTFDWSHEVAPHTATLAVWSVPDAIAAGQLVTFKVGASSTAGPVLAGCAVDIRDPSGAVIARASLGNEPWPGTAALQWTKIEVNAPAMPGIAAWTAHLVAAELAVAHEAVDCAFTLSVAAPPEHRVAVDVREGGTGAPLPDALVRIGAYRATTDDRGRATLHVPKGSADIVVWKTGYDAPEHTVEIDADTAVTISAAVVPEEDPDAHWKG